MTRAAEVIRFSEESFTDRPARDTAVSRAVLLGVGAGEEPETFRLHRTADLVAFGPHDRVAPGYARAVAAARAHGFGAIERLAGGRAAVFHAGTLAFSWAIPDPEPTAGIRTRFAELADLVVTAFRSLGLDARVGEVAGEYCPGEWSVNARGAVKLMGVGQRLVRGAAHVGGVIVVTDAARIRDVLVPVYDALDLEWDPTTAGSIEDELHRPVPLSEVAAAVRAELARRREVVDGPLGSAVLARADELEADHEPERRSA
jgi:octanoyl-[GcvH]:protein N-octanoyltransferase